MRRSDSEYEFKRLVRQKWALVIITAFVFLVSLGIFGVCIWIRFDLDFREWVREINWYSYWYAMYVIMISMVLVACTSLLLLYGAVAESRFALAVCLFLLVICWILELAGSICICVYGVEESEILTNDLREVFFALIYRMDYDDRASRILKIVQEYVRCCGANGSEDYIEAYKPVPVECRDQIDGGEFAYGCAQQFAWWLEPWTATLAGVCTTFLLIHIVQIVLISKIMGQIRRYERTLDYEN